MAIHNCTAWIVALALATCAFAPPAAALSQPKASAPAGATPPLGDPHRGAAIYETRCGACHSLDANRVGPRHRGVYGRRAGAVPDFAYSPALKASGLVWTAANLDRWLAGPTILVKGAAMGIRLPSPQDRRDVIASLKSQPGK